MLENPVFTRNMHYESISCNTIRKYLSSLTEHVESKIKTLLPNKFALVFDGWSTGSKHFECLFAVFPKDYEKVFQSMLLPCAPLIDET